MLNPQNTTPPTVLNLAKENLHAGTTHALIPLWAILLSVAAYYTPTTFTGISPTSARC